MQEKFTRISGVRPTIRLHPAENVGLVVIWVKSPTVWDFVSRVYNNQG